MDLDREEKGVRTLGSLREMDTGGSVAYISLYGSTGITKKPNCLFYKAPQPGQGSSWEHPAVLALGSQALGEGQVLYWQLDTLGQISESPEAWGTCCVRGQTPLFLWQSAPGSSAMASPRGFCHSESSPRGGWSIHPQKAMGPPSLRTGVSHFKQKQSGLLLQCLISCNYSHVEFGSKDTVDLTPSCPEQAGGCICPPKLQNKEVRQVQKWLNVLGYSLQNLCFSQLALYLHL